MRNDFRKRMGLQKARDTFQTTSLDRSTRGRLWNAVSFVINRGFHDQIIDDQLWVAYYHEFLEDAIPTYAKCAREHSNLQAKVVDSWTWDEVLEFVQWLGRRNSRAQSSAESVFKEDMVGYRFVDNLLVAITDDDQIATIDKALEDSKTANGAKEHLSNALSHLSPGNVSPRDAIREAVTAIEAHVRLMSGEKTLGAGIKKLRKSHALNPQFEQALTKLYAYTNDAKGIRHASDGFSESATVADAVFFLVTASAFISWLTASAAEG